MPFRPDSIQLRILQNLEEFQVKGVPVGAVDGVGRTTNVTLTVGVPAIILKASLGLGTNEEELRQAVDPLLLRKLIRKDRQPGWPLPFPNVRIHLSDGRAIVVCTNTTTGGATVRFRPQTIDVRLSRCESKTSPGTRRRPKNTSRGVHATAWAGTPKGTMLLNVREHHAWCSFPNITVFRITDRGARCLDACDARLDPDDSLVTLRQIAPLTGLSKRTLERHLHDELLPRPDVPGGKGYAHKWRWGSMRPALKPYSKKILPMRFPGERIV
jgi:hypothetical protein